MTASYEDLISLLAHALGQRTLFHRDHPRVRAGVRDFVDGLHRRLAEDRRDVFFLGIVDGRVVHGGQFLFGSTLLGRKLVKLAHLSCCGGFLFRSELGEDDVLALLDLAAELRVPVASLQDARDRLKARGCAIQLSPVYEDAGWFGQFLPPGVEAWSGLDATKREESLVPVIQALFDTVEAAHEQSAVDGAPDVNGARSAAEKMLRAVENDGMHDLLRVVRYPNSDTYTVGHSVRVAMLAVQVGRRLSLPPEFLIELGTAGLLHDVGKARIPRDILFKPGRLDDEERRAIAQHPRLGAELLLSTADAGPLCIGAAWGHHIRYDRRGYPAISSWHTVGKATELVHVCDVFEALTAVRPYKPALTPRRAFEIMLSERQAFHPGALSALVRSLGLFPPGSNVLLSTGERASVVAAGESLARPIVRLTHDARGAALAADAARDLDLAKLEPQSVSVVRLIDEPRAALTREESAIRHC